MPRARTPTSRALVTGAAAKNPKRFRDRVEPKAAGAIGDPPATLPASAKKAWALFVGEIPWLTASDRMALEMASVIRGKMIAREELDWAAFKELRLLLQQMGATPATRTKVSVADDEEDPDDALFTRPN